MNLREISETTANSSNYTAPEQPRELSDNQKETELILRLSKGPRAWLGVLVGMLMAPLVLPPMLFYAMWNDGCAAKESRSLACRAAGQLARAGMHFARLVHLATERWA